MTSPITPQQIIDCALKLAGDTGWEALRLSQVAEALDVPLAEIRQQFRSMDDVAEAWFDRVDMIMLKRASTKEVKALPKDERLYHCIMAWFEALIPHKPLVKEMLAYKLEPGHIHLQAHGITRISRTVQWFLDAADCDYVGVQRIAEELAVTTTYLLCFTCFLNDQSSDHARTRNLLRQLLTSRSRGQQLLASFCPPGLKTMSDK